MHGRGTYTCMSPTVPSATTLFHWISGLISLCAWQARVQYSQPVHFDWSMTMAHWCLPLGAPLEALVGETALVPAATATPTAANLMNSRRLMFWLAIVVLLVVLDCTLIPALEPGGQDHAASKTQQTGQGGKANRADRLR